MCYDLKSLRVALNFSKKILGKNKILNIESVKQESLGICRTHELAATAHDSLIFNKDYISC